MATVNVTIFMDEDLKNQAETLFDDLGMNLTEAVTLFAKVAVSQQKIPFEIAADPFFNEVNQERLRRAIADLESGKATAHELIEVDNESNC